MKQFYRCDTCGSLKNRVENGEVVLTEHGPVINVELTCRHCHSINLMQISSSGDNVIMEVIGKTVPKRTPASEMKLDDCEWP